MNQLEISLQTDWTVLLTVITSFGTLLGGLGVFYGAFKVIPEANSIRKTFIIRRDYIKMQNNFKEKYMDLQVLVRELLYVRNHNMAIGLTISKGNKLAETELLAFSEANLVLMVLERFLRILPDLNATKSDTLYNLLERAISKKIIVLPTNEPKKLIVAINDIRNQIIHANFEESAKSCGFKTVGEYFKNQFFPEIEAITNITNNLMEQIDANTGKPK